jgi:DNA-directed RNA polymerase specialized sigma24 family protein
MRALNERPGDPIVHRPQVYRMAEALGLPIPRPSRAEPACAAAPVPLSAPISAAPEDTKAEVIEALNAGQTVRAIAEDFGLPISTVSNWHAEWKQRSGSAAA